VRFSRSASVDLLWHGLGRASGEADRGRDRSQHEERKESNSESGRGDALSSGSGAVLCAANDAFAESYGGVAEQEHSDEDAGREAAGYDERSDPLVARGPGARVPQQDQTGNPADTEDEATEQEQDDRGPFVGSGTIGELVGFWRFGRDDRLGLAELVENRECL
jgi:hypothetical protein